MTRYLKILLNIFLVLNLFLYANDSSSVNLNKMPDQTSIIKPDKSDSIYVKVKREILPNETLKNLKNKPALQQIDALKNLHVTTRGLDVPAKNIIAKKLSHHSSHKLWINRKDYSKDQVVSGLTELNCFPIIMPVSGEINTLEDITEYWSWLNTFERHGIDILKQLSFGFDIKEPAREDNEEPYVPPVTNKLDDENFEKLFELHQMSKQFKYIDSTTKVIFVRNRIPRTLIKSGIKPKASKNCWISGTLFCFFII